MLKHWLDHNVVVQERNYDDLTRSSPVSDVPFSWLDLRPIDHKDESLCNLSSSGLQTVLGLHKLIPPQHARNGWDGCRVLQLRGVPKASRCPVRPGPVRLGRVSCERRGTAADMVDGRVSASGIKARTTACVFQHSRWSLHLVNRAASKHIYPRPAPSVRQLTKMWAIAGWCDLDNIPQTSPQTVGL